MNRCQITTILNSIKADGEGYLAVNPNGVGFVLAAPTSGLPAATAQAVIEVLAEYVRTHADEVIPRLQEDVQLSCITAYFDSPEVRTRYKAYTDHAGAEKALPLAAWFAKGLVDGSAYTEGIEFILLAHLLYVGSGVLLSMVVYVTDAPDLGATYEALKEHEAFTAKRLHADERHILVTALFVSGNHYDLLRPYQDSGWEEVGRKGKVVAKERDLAPTASEMFPVPPTDEARLRRAAEATLLTLSGGEWGDDTCSRILAVVMAQEGAAGLLTNAGRFIQMVLQACSTVGDALLAATPAEAAPSPEVTSLYLTLLLVPSGWVHLRCGILRHMSETPTKSSLDRDLFHAALANVRAMLAVRDAVASSNVLSVLSDEALMGTSEMPRFDSICRLLADPTLVDTIEVSAHEEALREEVRPIRLDVGEVVYLNTMRRDDYYY
jgi:hypothetical protein